MAIATAWSVAVVHSWLPRLDREPVGQSSQHRQHGARRGDDERRPPGLREHVLDDAELERMPRRPRMRTPRS